MLKIRRRSRPFGSETIPVERGVAERSPHSNGGADVRPERAGGRARSVDPFADTIRAIATRIGTEDNPSGIFPDRAGRAGRRELAMGSLSRRELLLLAIAASGGLAHAGDAASEDVHQQLLDLAVASGERAACPLRRRQDAGRAGDLCKGRSARRSSDSSTASPREWSRSRRSRRRARSRPTITSSRSSSSRAFPAISCRPCSTGPRRSPGLCRRPQPLRPLRDRQGGRAPTRSCTSTWRSAATSS